MKKELWIVMRESGHHLFHLRYTKAKCISFTREDLVLKPFSIGVINHGRVNAAGALLALEVIEDLGITLPPQGQVKKQQELYSRLKTYMAEYLEETE